MSKTDSNSNFLLFQERDYSPLSTPNGIHNPRPSTSDAPVTPSSIARSLLQEETPRTPTPFKKALADLEKKSGPIKTLPDTPTTLEDITEIMRKEQDISSNYESDTSSLMVTVSQVRSTV